MNHTGTGTYASLNQMHDAVTRTLAGSHGRIIKGTEPARIRVPAGHGEIVQNPVRDNHTGIPDNAGFTSCVPA